VELLAYLAELTRSLGSMSGYYLREGLVFFLAHSFVFVSLLYLWWFYIRSETRALEGWPERKPADSVPVRMLDQFVEESQTLGRRGVLLPIVDLSERLTSRVTVYADRLHSRVNLFLIVGVAGTFFAMFKFIFDAKSRGIPVTTALEQGLMQAFPIGFFGLAWTFIGHYIAFHLEERLRNAVNGAVRHAMSARTAYLRTTVDEIAEALAPLKDLQTTLRDTLAPVIEGFREELKLASRLMGEQVQPLSSVIGDLQKATVSLATPVERLSEASQGFPETMGRIAQLQQDASDAVERMARSSVELESKLSAAAVGLTAASDTLKQLPAELTTQFAANLAGLRNDARDLWNAASSEFFASLKPACHSLDSAAGSLGAVAAALASLPGRIEQQTAQSMQQLFEAVTNQIAGGVMQLTAAANQLWRLCSSLEGAAAQMATTFEEQCRSLADRSAEAWSNASENFLRDIAQRAEVFWIGIREESQKAAERLKSAADGLVSVSNAVDEVLKKSHEEIYNRLVESATPHLERIQRTISEHYPKVLSNLTEAAQQTRAIADNVARVRQSLAAAGDHIDKASEHWQQAARQLESLLAAIKPDEQVVRELRRIAASTDSVTKGVEALRRDLAVNVLKGIPKGLVAIFTDRRRPR
jgi:ABC-type transporter Mla subunit MlaD